MNKGSYICDDIFDPKLAYTMCKSCCFWVENEEPKFECSVVFLVSLPAVKLSLPRAVC